MLGHEDFQNKMQQATTFVAEENLENEYAQKSEVFEQNREESVNKAKRDNELIGFSLKNAQVLSLDVSKTARLQSIKGRNLSIILLNSPDYAINSPAMQKVKDAVAAVEDAITKPASTFVRENDKEAKKIDRTTVSVGFANVAIMYQDAINACTEYLNDKNDMSPAGVERYKTVKRIKRNLLDEKVRLSMVQQLYFRKGIATGEDYLDVTIKDLFLEERMYLDAHPTVTRKQLDHFKDEKVKARSFYYVDNLIKEKDFQGRNELKFVCNTLTQKFLPDAMIKEFGDKEEDKKKAVHFIREIYKIISSIPEGKLVSKAIFVDGIVVNLFQLEDGSLDIAYDYTIRHKNKNDPTKENVEVIMRHHNLPSTTKTIVSSMAANIAEHEDIFGSEIVEKIIADIGKADADKDMAGYHADSDIASAYIRSKLGINNIALTNVSHDDRIKLAKDLCSGKLTKELGREYLETYEYGGKGEKLHKDAKKKEGLDKLKKQMDDLDGIAKIYGYANMEEYIKSYKKFKDFPAESIEYENRLKKSLEQEAKDVNARIGQTNEAYQRNIKLKQDERLAQKKAYDKAVGKGTTTFNTKLERYYAESDAKTEEMMGRKDAIEAQWSEKIQAIEATYAGKTSDKDKKDKKKALSDLEKQYNDKAKEIEVEWGAWAKGKEQELNTLSQQVSQGWEDEYKKITDIDDQIIALQNMWAEDIAKIANDYNVLRDQLQIEFDYLEDWKDYYETCALTGQKELLTFNDWKEQYLTHSQKLEGQMRNLDTFKEVAGALVDQYLNVKDDYEILESSDTSITATHVNGSDTIELLIHRKNMEEAGLLKDKVIFDEDVEKEKEQENQDKQKEYDPKTMWSPLEEELRDFVSEFIYSEKTWEMDLTAYNPGKRLFGLLSKNKQLCLTIVTKKEEDLSKIITEFVSKLPTAVMGMKAEDLSGILISMTKDVKKMVKDRVDKDIKERDKARELRKDAKRWAIIRKEHPGEAQDVLEAEFKKLKEYKPGGLFGFHFFETEEEKSARLKMEAKLKEIEKAGKDDEVLKDFALRGQSAETIIKLAINTIFTGKDDEDSREYVGKLSAYEKELNEMMTGTLYLMKDTMKEFVQETFGDSGALQEEIEKVPFYRKEKDEEKRKKLEKKGDEQLLKMIKNSAASETGQGQYIRNIFAEYIPNCSALDLKSMLASAIRNAKPTDLPDNPTDAQKYKAVASYVGGLFKGAGPLFQKVLQGLSGNMIPKGLEEAFEDVKCNLAPIPKEIVEAQMLSIIERSAGKIQKIHIVKSLGAASIGQAFLCNVINNEGYKEEVVIKLLRPDARNRMLREEKILRKCAAGAGLGMLKTFEGQMVHLKEELDLTIEAKNCEYGSIYDKSNGKVKSMKVSRMAPATPNAMMLKRAPGDTVVNIIKSSRALRNQYLKEFYEYDKNGDLVHTDKDTIKLNIKRGANTYDARVELSNRLEQLQDQQQRLLDMCDGWVRQAIFGEGFYHGDLHAGNIMMDKDKLTIIDFGNCTKLTPDEQKKILTVMMAATAGDYEAFLDGYGAMLSQESLGLFAEKKSELKKIFKEIMQLGTYTSSASRIGAALMKAQELGFELPASIYGFQQCQMRIQSTVDDFNNEIKEIKSALEQLGAEKVKGTIQHRENYLEISRQTTYDKPKSFMITLLPEDDTDGVLTKMIRANTPEQRQKVLDCFSDTFTKIEKLVNDAPKNNMSQIYGQFGSEMAFYEEVLSGFITRDRYKEIVSDGKLKFADYYGHVTQEHFLSEDPEDVRIRTEKIKALIEEVKKYNVLGALKRYYEAQDNKAPKDEIDRLEKEVIQTIIETKKVYQKNKLSFIEEDIKKKNADKPDATDAQKQANLEKIIKTSTIEGRVLKYKEVWEPFKVDLMNAEKKEAMEEEISQYYSDPVFGDMIKASYEDLRKQLDKNPDQVIVDEKMDKLIRVISGSLLLSMGTRSGSQKHLKEYDTDEERDFFDVTGDVIREEWKNALKKLGIYNSLSFGRKIASDAERKDIGRVKFLFRTLFSD